MKLSQPNQTTYIRSIITGAIAGIALASMFMLGIFAREIFGIPPPLALATDDPTESAGYPLIDEVQDLLDQVYLRDQPGYTERQYAAIRGLLSSLDDPNTFFIDPPVARSEAQALAGTYGGIGVQLRRNEAGAFVLYPFPESPAREAGIIDGAELIAIDGMPVDQTTQVDAVDQLMRGEVDAGNGIQLTVRQAGEDFMTFVEFAVINVPSVVARVLDQDERIAYVQVLRFTSRTPDELEETLRDLDVQSLQGLVLDLRDNSGGLLNESVQVASQFLDGGVVIYEVTQDEETAINAERGGVATEIPLVVLVNRGTASASELVAGAIRDRDRGILIGQQTFGKGTVQQIFTLSDGSSVHITSAEWFTPDRVPLAGVGLEPTIAMIPHENGRDVELGEAVRYLQEQIASQ
jgi:carboxyl-terminal processing protease